jgi:hypothetical protein
MSETVAPQLSACDIQQNDTQHIEIQDGNK